jgi:hypothetical protein
MQKTGPTMPQASDEDRAKMAKYFGGDGISDAEPTQYLHGKGWIFTRGGLIQKPQLAGYNPCNKEWDCLYFLCDEWDYGYDG